jgi:cobalt-zinc-cadmium efflux system membrane fusion protein
MSDNSKIALGVAGGYLLGRTKKMKLALSLGGLLIGQKIPTNPRDLLKRDMLVNVSIRAGQGRNGILVPVSAVLRDDQNLPFVYLALPSNRFARRQVTIGSRIGDDYEIRSGLAVGDRLVVDGALFLQFAGNQ